MSDRAIPRPVLDLLKAIASEQPDLKSRIDAAIFEAQRPGPRPTCRCQECPRCLSRIRMQRSRLNRKLLSPG